MEENLSNSERKIIIGAAIKAQKALIQASIDTRNKKQIVRHNAIIAQQLEREKRLFNMNKPLFIIYALLGQIIVIIAIVDVETEKVIYGPETYDRDLKTEIHFGKKGKRGMVTSSKYIPTYEVSTSDGETFSFQRSDGTIAMEFESPLTYPELRRQTEKNVQIRPFLYDPRNIISDENKKQPVEYPKLSPEIAGQFVLLVNKIVQELSSKEFPYHISETIRLLSKSTVAVE
jgi:uncharacterized protein YdhG (YjbR/CyaY superfamily)